MDQSYIIAIEGLNHVVPKWSNRSSKVGHLVFSLGQWCAIVAYQIPCLSGYVVPIYTSQACHDDLYPFPMNADEAPQPVIIN